TDPGGRSSGARDLHRRTAIVLDGYQRLGSCLSELHEGWRSGLMRQEASVPIWAQPGPVGRPALHRGLHAHGHHRYVNTPTPQAPRRGSRGAGRPGRVWVTDPAWGPVTKPRETARSAPATTRFMSNGAIL